MEGVKRSEKARGLPAISQGYDLGIGEYFGWDPNLVRLAFALSILLPGPQLLVYLALWLVIPRAAA